MYNFSKYKEQYRSNLALAFPVVLSQLGQVIVQLADTIMVGQYGGDNPGPLAAAAFGNSVFFLVYIACMGLTFGVTPIVGALFVQNKRKKLADYLHNGLVIFPLIGALATLLLYAITPLMYHMGQPVETVVSAVPYYHILCWSIIPTMVFFVFKQFLEGMGNTVTSMYIVITTNIINIALNYVMINGHCGFEEMGANGAALSTLISRTVQMLLMIGFFLYVKRYRRYIANFSFKRFSAKLSRKLLAMGIPISSQMFFESSAFVITSILMGSFGETFIGANQIGSTLMNCAFMIVLSVGSASTIRISHCYGNRNYAEMKLASSAAWHLAFVWNMVTALTFITLRSVLPHIFTTNAQMIEMASILLIYIALFQISDGLQCVSVGILRGMQDVRIILPIAIFSYWVLNIPVGVFCAFTLGMGAKGLYIGYVVGLSVAAVLMYRRIVRRQKKLLGSYGDLQ